MAEAMPPMRARFVVKTLNGIELSLLHEREKNFYENARDRYTQDFSFTIGSDMRALDRLLLLEIQVFRAQWQLAAGQDYDGVDLEPTEEVAHRRTIKECNAQISEIQRDLNLTIDKRAKDEQSVADYLQKLRTAAKEHGIRRERQVSKAIELWNELIAVVGAYQRSNDNEKRKLGFDSPDELFEWIMGPLKDEFDEVDRVYTETFHKFWVRQL